MNIALIKLTTRHSPLFYKWWNDPVLRRLTSETKELVSQDEINKILGRHLLDRNSFDFIITADAKSIGHILIQRKKNKKNFEIYIAIGEKRYWNKGIGTIVMNRACRWFFKNFLKETSLTLQVLVHNRRAIQCYEKVGFKKIRTVHHRKMSDTWLMIKTRE
ncbi:GNAT family N-acetyltransferase [Candidatus Falkowbacteria bacterium]|nr:GNAT family N-acetyltransferase [Candidatus Falkowbacteria bacterium]